MLWNLCRYEMYLSTGGHHFQQLNKVVKLKTLFNMDVPSS
jgi:hypothetical protein